MTTWKHCIGYYEKIFDLLQEYSKTHLKAGKDDEPLKNIGLHILEKIHINLINCIDLLRKVETQPLNFLSLGLILRGMVSDIINYRYLRKISEITGSGGLNGEIAILELSFVKAYKRMVDNEKKMAKGDPEKEELIEKTFQKNFARFYNGNELKAESDYRSKEFLDHIHHYLEQEGLEKTVPISTEAGKMKFVKDQHTERIQILYTYLSQLQHFSGRAYNFYKTKEYADFNPRFTLMLLFFTILVIIPIIKDLAPGPKTLEQFVELAKEIAES